MDDHLRLAPTRYNPTMLMPPAIRKFALTTHVTSSVGWFGAVAAFFVLAVAGVMSTNALTVRSAYVSMELVTWTVIVPFSIAALLTGIVQGLGTTWGLFRHQWVIAKLVLTVIATVLLLVHAQGVGRVAAVATERALSVADLRSLRVQLIADAGAALMALVVATTLSVYKPWGLTIYGRDGTLIETERDLNASRVWTALWFAGLVGALTLFALMHLFGGMHYH